MVKERQNSSIPAVGIIVNRYKSISRLNAQERMFPDVQPEMMTWDHADYGLGLQGCLNIADRLLERLVKGKDRCSR
jgi:hypothetical protein